MLTHVFIQFPSDSLSSVITCPSDNSRFFLNPVQHISHTISRWPDVVNEQPHSPTILIKLSIKLQPAKSNSSLGLPTIYHHPANPAFALSLS